MQILPKYSAWYAAGKRKALGILDELSLGKTMLQIAILIDIDMILSGNVLRNTHPGQNWVAKPNNSRKTSVWWVINHFM